MLPELAVAVLTALVPLAPFASFVSLGSCLLILDRPHESVTASIVMSGLVVSALAALLLAIDVVLFGAPAREIDVGNLFGTGEYAFPLELLVDRLSAPMWMVATSITAMLGRASVPYLHREAGFHRFFLLLSLFATGMSLIVGGATIDLMFAGWEAVGLSSMLLVAFFAERRGPKRASIRVFVTYRACDIGLVIGIALLHDEAGTTEIVRLLGGAEWPDVGIAPVHGAAATLIALCFLVGATGKSALFPVSGWLPRAMEGPTPSSALFYGALSVHGGVYLMLRAAPLLEESPVARIVVGTLGAVTAIAASASWRVQTDAKSALGFAAISQVGLMFVEIALGFTWVAAIHMMAHAYLRAFQLLRAPSAFDDARAERREPDFAATLLQRVLPRPVWVFLYGLALDRFHIDDALDRFVARPVRVLSGQAENLEHRFDLSGPLSRVLRRRRRSMVRTGQQPAVTVKRPKG